MDIDFARFELTRNGKAREDVPSGATTRDHHPPIHAFTSRERLRRIPIETSVTSISVLP